MRIISAIAISAVSLVSVSPRLFVSANEPVVEHEEDDDDWAGIDVSTEDEAGEPGTEQDSSLAEAADADLSEPERKMRMGICVSVARQKFARTRDMLKPIMDSMKELHKIDDDQASELIHVSMIKNCYINMDQGKDFPELISSTNDDEKWDEVADRLVAPPAGEEPGKQSTLAARHWEYVREFVENEKSGRESGEDIFDFSSLGKINVIGSGMGTFQRFLYFVSVFGAIFGSGYLLVNKLIQKEVEKVTRKSKKKN